jgi:hypothetical protein
VRAAQRQRRAGYPSTAIPRSAVRTATNTNSVARALSRERGGRPDSPVEQKGFEPPVPLAKVRVIFGEKGPEVISVVSKDVVFFPGTSGSNPFCSTSESAAD